MSRTPPVVGFAAYSGTGKTTLICRVIPLLRQRGLEIAVIKHAHHTFEIDQPGKDSYELRKAGAVYESQTAFRDLFATHVVVDDEKRFVTGQNQNSGLETSHRMMQLVAERDG